ncbi:hypothetical protein ACOYX3_11875 [Enterococcus entomosocium]|nr:MULTISPECIES: hypothetical protein [unclassified Enterococcus]
MPTAAMRLQNTMPFFSSSIIAITMLPIARPIIMTLEIFSFQ